ncbi:MAG: DNA-binding response regulator [Cyanobium sp.]|uniref:response regulator transcription factor n=1 Tax=Synechococcus sp. CS-1333 TaxID=2848638 RepID=UPI000DBC0AC9|nr:response regulator transcription factor [Synechococcus sp. CS-1333]MCT0210314.1 response regulator transcription factor [Synechococcus sp. CS-1333]PZV23296.1 MAG: DNA-binding response regulator [Cyanobium sp.]
MIRVLVVDDQSFFREGLSALLSLESDIDVVGQAADGRVAIDLTGTIQPDVILMDIRMPNCDGVTATREILRSYPWIRILVLTTFDQDDYVWESLKAGATGYLIKNTPSGQVADAIRTIHKGHSQLGPTIAPKVFAQIQQPVRATPANLAFSERELLVLKLLGQGKTNREIATTLHITEGTVRNYVSRILSELGLNDRTQAALWAHGNLD